MTIPDEVIEQEIGVPLDVCEYPDSVRSDFTAGAKWARKEARAQVLKELRWLASARAEYCHISHDDAAAWHLATAPEQWLHSEHQAVEHVADIIDGANDGMGWLPSSRWDDWTELHALAEEDSR